MYRMFELTGKPPWHEYWDEIEPMQKLWLYEAWIAKEENDLERDKAFAIFQGSFSNPEMARKFYNKENPQFQSSDKEWEDSWKMVQADGNEPKPKKRKSRRKKRVVVK